MTVYDLQFLLQSCLRAVSSLVAGVPQNVAQERRPRGGRSCVVHSVQTRASGLTHSRARSACRFSR